MVKMMNEYLEEVKTTRKHEGYFFSVEEAIIIALIGSFCGLKSVKKIHQWAKNVRISEFLEKEFNIVSIPCYYWLLTLLKLIEPESLNKCFIDWVSAMMSERGFTASLDGKTTRSTCKMKKYKNPLHIISAQIAELGITLGQQTVDGKSNEIPAVRDLIKLLNLNGCMIVADALNCQKETAQTVIDANADYLLSVKDNQPTLKKEIADIVHNEEHQKEMDICKKTEKNRGRIETRTAYVFNSADLISSKDDWANLACIGAINTQFSVNNVVSNEWHYYISSKKLTAEEMLHHARLEWSVETMHWLLDVHFGEDFCRVQDEVVLQNLNIFHKIVLNYIKLFKEKKKPQNSDF